MTASRSTRQEHEYQRLLAIDRDDKAKECPFCKMKERHPQFVRQERYFKVIRNRTPYSLWDEQVVLDHLMIVPIKHTAKVSDLGGEAAEEYVRLLGEYDERGYCMFARALNASVRSVVHQHTHLMKLDGKKRRFLFMVRKPWYFRLSR